MNHLLDWHLLDDATWEGRIEAALRHAREPKWTPHPPDRSIGLLFFNPSLRTRTSMELAAAQLGAHATTLVPGQGVWGFAWEPNAIMNGAEAEHIIEAAGVLSQYYDALGVRLFASMTDHAQDAGEVLMRRFMEAASVPVVNLESAFYHPCQALADAATITERFGERVKKRKFVLAWSYHPKRLPMAVPHSALLMATRLGMDVTIARPEGFGLDTGVIAQAKAYAEAQGADFTETTDLDVACEGAEVVYAKAWGGPLVYSDPEREAALRPTLTDWRITSERMAKTYDGAFMHCLPVRRGVVVDGDVLDGPQAIHLRQAAYRLYAQKAILEWMWGMDR